MCTQAGVQAQIINYPYNQGFEDDFVEYGQSANFLFGLSGNEVRDNLSRIYQSFTHSRSGNKALGVQVISSFDASIILDLDLTNHELMELRFYARSVKNGSGSRPVLIRVSTSLNGGLSYFNTQNIGDEKSFPNEDTEYTLYTYALPASSGFQPSVKVKLEVVYTTVFGEGTAARVMIDDLKIDKRDEEVKLLEIVAEQSAKLTLFFNQQLDEKTSENVDHYFIDKSFGNPKAARLNSDQTSVELTLSAELDPGDYTLTVFGIKNKVADLTLKDQTISFSFIPEPEIPKYNELLITEIMADPEPAEGLPVAEYVELYNPTNKVLSLNGIQFSDASTSSVLPDVIIQPGEYLILTSRTKAIDFDQFENVLGISKWPTLNIGGDQLSLTSKDGGLIFSIEYHKSWYRDALKNEGGWSLEMIDTSRPCGESENWVASIDPSGGTPGNENSVKASMPDLLGPKLLRSIAISNNQVQLFFNEKISFVSPSPSSFQLDHNIIIASSEIDPTDSKVVTLTLENVLDFGILYEVSVSDISDCCGNYIVKDHSTALFALPEPADRLDVVINEILFRPRSGGVKFIEIYNKSNKYINLKDWKIDPTDGSFSLIVQYDFILNPGSYLALTSDSEILKAEYPKASSNNFLDKISLTGIQSSGGKAILLNEKDILIDHVVYSEDMHSPLLKETKGVSLERISFSEPSENLNNWQSSASTIGFASPGSKNSQAKDDYVTNENFRIEPKVILPESTGIADFATINYKFDVSGNSGSLLILDPHGRVIRTIAQNELLPTEGFFTWDGMDDNRQKARMGYYLVYFEIYNLNGDIEIWKDVVVVGKRLK